MARRLLLLLACVALLGAAVASRHAERPGPVSRDVTLLPNGWRIAPAGRHMAVGDLPLNLVETRDGRYAIVTNNGYAKPSLTVVDLIRQQVASRFDLDHAWLGLAWHPDGKRLYVSASGENAVSEVVFDRGELKPARSFSLRAPQQSSFVAGVAVAPDGGRLFAVHALGELLSAVDLESGRLVKDVPLSAEAYEVLVAPDGKTVFVSLWGGAKVLLFDARTLDPTGEVAVGEHPNSMVLTRDGARLFVACGNTNAVYVVDVAARVAREQIGIALYPGAPNGSTPNGLDLSPDETRLLVANADNNTVAVVDVASPGRSQVLGFVPTGWYPTAAHWTTDGKSILILSAKGLSSQPNPRGSQPGIKGPEGQYVGAMLEGTLSILPAPDEKALAAYSKTVYALTPYDEAKRLRPEGASAETAIPRRVGDPSPIKNVIYIVRENRTYDQILGDLPQGDGDPRLCLFGEQTTPNAHALATEFVLFDNFYVDAEVSYDGHSYSTAAYATDFTEKVWPMNYARREGSYLSEGGGKLRNAYGNITAPQHGYIWDAAVRAGLGVRSYGEFAGRRSPEAEDESGDEAIRALVPGLEGRVSPRYPGYDLKIRDNARIDVWLEEFREFERRGALPRLMILRLPNDHTGGTRPDLPTPRAMIAENDVALGRLVEAVSKSRFWKETAIFVLEDDAQNGPDHVDAHRSVLLVASPYARRGSVDHTMYTTSGVLRTIELILGIPPMSQYDAAAAPMFGAFGRKPDLRPFTSRPARVNLDERNNGSDYGVEASLRMDLDEEADRAPDLLLNEIVWRSVRGRRSPMPPPVRAAFVRARPVTPDDEDDARR